MGRVMKIKEIRTSKDISISFLARKTEVSYNTLTKKIKWRKRI